MVGGIAGVATVVAVAGLFVGSQLVGADRPSIRTVAATPTDDTVPAGDRDDVGEDGLGADDPADHEDAEWTAYERCVDEALSAGGDEFEACLDDQLGDLLGDLDDVAWNGAVVVERLGDDEQGGVTVYDFGEGDGSVVVTKTDGSITVEASGEVTTFEESDFEANAAEWQDALAACSELLPDLFDRTIGDLGERWEEFPLDDVFDDEQLGELFENGELGPLLDELLGDGELGPLLDQLLGDGELGPLLDQLLENGELGPLLDELLGDGELGPLLDQLLENGELGPLFDDEQLGELGPLLDELLGDGELGPLLDELLGDGELGPLLDELLGDPPAPAGD